MWTVRHESMGYQINHLARLLAALLNQRIAPLGVVPGQFAQLLALYESDGQSPGELARAVSIEPATMTKTLKRMERDGLIRREPDPDDGRRARIYLTDHAWSLESELTKAAGTVNKVILGSVDEVDGAQFMVTLATLIDAAEHQLGVSATDAEAT